MAQRHPKGKSPVESLGQGDRAIPGTEKVVPDYRKVVDEPVFNMSEEDSRLLDMIARNVEKTQNKDSLNSIYASKDINDKTAELDNVFSESVAKCGRIFGKSHPYFKVAKADKDKLKEYVENIRKQYYG